jgi:hypothetical protein
MDDWGLEPADDGYHPPTVDDPAWHENVWFAFMAPERKLLGSWYLTLRPNLGVLTSSVALMDDTAEVAWEAPFHSHDAGSPMPAEVDLRDVRLANGLHLRCLEAGRVFTFGYEHPELTLDLRYEALVPPLISRGEPPFARAAHVDQPGRVTGTAVLRGERIDIDCLAMRDRMWGIRRQSRDPARQLKVGYCYATASADDAFLAVTVDRDGVDGAMTGFSQRDGTWSPVVSGERRVLRDGRGRVERVTFDGLDELGRDVHAEGDVVARQVAASNMVCWNSLVRWDLRGATCWGEDQDVWPVHRWRDHALGRGA